MAVTAENKVMKGIMKFEVQVPNQTTLYRYCLGFAANSKGQMIVLESRNVSTVDGTGKIQDFFYCSKRGHESK